MLFPSILPQPGPRVIQISILSVAQAKDNHRLKYADPSCSKYLLSLFCGYRHYFCTACGLSSSYRIPSSDVGKDYCSKQRYTTAPLVPELAAAMSRYDPAIDQARDEKNKQPEIAHYNIQSWTSKIRSCLLLLWVKQLSQLLARIFDTNPDSTSYNCASWTLVARRPLCAMRHFLGCHRAYSCSRKLGTILLWLMPHPHSKPHYCLALICIRWKSFIAF